MSEARPSWDAERIGLLQGQEETIRLEFKSGRFFEKDRSKWVAEISEAVSAFANTEGGTILIGVPEDKVGSSKRRLAGAPDGVADDRIGSDDLQRAVEGNVSPPLSGVRVHRVPLPAQPGRSVIVIDVPQGTTAYQANDRKYYGRSEFESKALPDHEIRLRMFRGKTGHAAVDLRSERVSLSHPQLTPNQIPRDPLENPIVRMHRIEQLCKEQLHDEVLFAITIRNDGEVTIREPVVSVVAPSAHAMASPESGGDWFAGFDLRLQLKGLTLYPDDTHDLSLAKGFPNLPVIRCKGRLLIEPGTCVARWTVFMDNSLPSRGEVDVGLLVNAARNSKPERHHPP